MMLCRGYRSSCVRIDARTPKPGLRPPCDGGLFHNHDCLRGRSGPVVFSASCAVPLNFLRTRSMDRVGRKSETTLRIAGLHFEISPFRGLATEQLKLPSGAPNAWHRQWG